MPRDFKNFVKDQEKIIDENKDKANDYQNILNKYKNMDNNELMSNLFSEASRLKSEGKLDSNSLNSLKTTLAPFLNNDQQNMLNNIVEALNNQK